MKTRFVLLFAVFVFAAGHAFAQTAPQRAAPAAPPAPPAPAVIAPAPPPPPPPPPGPPRREGQPINVKVDLNITEEGGNAPPVKKSVSAVAGDGFNGSVREMSTSGTVTTPPNFTPLNLDAYPEIMPNGKIRVRCSIQYQSAQSREPGSRASTDIKQNFVLILESGKPIVATQTTDPISDRKVTVEVTATILK